MLFVVRFEDHQNKATLRSENLQSHIEWLAANSQSVLVGGSLREEPGATPVGGLWVVEASSKQEVADLVADDPFWKVGLRKKIEVLHWSKAFEDRKVLV